MNERLLPAAVLVLPASILPEMLAGNTPAAALFQPGPLLFFTAAYGLPVLVLREFAVRQPISFAGLFLIGLGYGIINEALLAKTVFRSVGVPVDVYDGYGFAARVQWAWTAFILPWHALASVMLPIAFAHRAAPVASDRPWLGVRAAWALALVLFGLISFFFLFEDTSGIPGSAPMLALLWSMIGALALAARALPRPPSAAPAAIRLWKPFALGISGVIPFLSLLAVASLKWPLPAYLAAVLLWTAFYARLLRGFADINYPAFGWFGLGWYVQIGVFSWLDIAAEHPWLIAADLLAFALLVWIVLRRKGASA
jgi:hypothetical protein